MLGVLNSNIVVKFGGSPKLYVDFQLYEDRGRLAPLTPTLFKDQL